MSYSHARRVDRLEEEVNLQAPENRPVLLEEVLAASWPGAAPLDPRRPSPIGDLLTATYERAHHEP